ncbi:MAG: 6-carboxytetrahydropterin synthase QueD [Candidatus Abyssobacteria bacterium SURF_5]|uniref:6-carboxy-5,6,7,8-tetrahydropterin synthase n=1 Tax=Abyssobacteria bacterium (strain SURF_5) TaxID=2093360 RepID=A0A3A4P249_ABYX5|nr:MAG: 6-carboxytetrahydropterin synthase QueD [Candidatus Abyssubacteria bacterium SURF_5]
MYELTIKTTFSAAHSLRDYEGPCSKVHGHNWVVEVIVSGENLQPNGILIDFGEVKEAASEVLARLDHANLNEVPPFDRLNPSSENLARWIFEEVGKRVNSKELRVSRVNIREAETSCASYFL